LTRGQKLGIAAVLCAPVAIGLILLSFENRRNQSFIPGAQARRIGLVRITDIVYVADNYVWQLRELRKDKSVAGVLIRIESPGGGVAPAQEIYREVMRYREENKPLVVSMGNVAASGGYYLASPAMKIFANPGTLTGSMGVIMRFPHYYKLFEKIGVDMQTLKAGKFKDIGTPDREMSAQERELLQGLLDDTHEQFIEDVGAARSMDLDSLRKLADGRVFSGRQAFRLGLVDSLGGYDEALGFLRDYVGLSERAKVTEKRRRRSLLKDVLAEDVLSRIPFVNMPRRPGGAYFLLENR
jgi:protease-4